MSSTVFIRAPRHYSSINNHVDFFQIKNTSMGALLEQELQDLALVLLNPNRNERVWSLFQPHSLVSMLLIPSQLLWHKGYVSLGVVSWNWRALLKFSFSLLKSPAMVNHQLTKFIGGTALGMSRLWAQPNDSLTYAFVPLLCSSLDFSNCLSFSCGLLAKMLPTIPTIIALLECLLPTERLHRLVKWPELYEFSLKSPGPHNCWKNVKEGEKKKKKRSLVMGKGQSQVFLQ